MPSLQYLVRSLAASEQELHAWLKQALLHRPCDARRRLQMAGRETIRAEILLRKTICPAAGGLPHHVFDVRPWPALPRK